MIEGIRSVKPWTQPQWLLRFLTAIDLLIPALDVAYALVWLPGLVLVATGRYWIVGPYTLAVLPLPSWSATDRSSLASAGNSSYMGRTWDARCQAPGAAARRVASMVAQGRPGGRPIIARSTAPSHPAS